MSTKKKYRKNFQDFKSLFHHSYNELKTDKVWICESLGKLKGVWHQETVNMNELSNHKIADLQLHIIHHGIPKVHIWGFGQIYDIALQDLPGQPHPYFKDHRKAKNRYLSRYVEMKSSTAMSKLCCITNLIRFIMNEAEKLMEGSDHEEYFFIVHNALVLITEKETDK